MEGGEGTGTTATGVAKLKVGDEGDGDAKQPPPEPVPADLHRTVTEWALKQDRAQVFVSLNSGSSVELKPGDPIPKEFAAIRHLIVHLPNLEAMTAQAAACLRALPKEETALEIWLQSADWNDDTRWAAR